MAGTAWTEMVHRGRKLRLGDPVIYDQPDPTNGSAFRWKPINAVIVQFGERRVKVSFGEVQRWVSYDRVNLVEKPIDAARSE